MNKKQFLAIMCSIALLVGTITVQGASVSNGDNPGDINENPWADLFAETTTPEFTTTPVVETITFGTNTPTSEKVTAPKKVTIKKVYTKKKTAKKVKLTLKKITGIKGYQVAIYKTKKNAKKNKKALIKKFVKRTNVTINSKKLKNKKILYVRARAYVMDGKTKLYGNWSIVKKVKSKQ